MTIARHLKKAGLALVAVSSMAGLQQAWADGTDAGVTINNRATVTYSVGSVAQTAIESSPTGNATPGVNAGEDTTFVVDRRVFFTVTAIAGAPATVPGATGVVRAFTVHNDSNAPIGFSLTSANVASPADQFDVNPNPPTVRVDSVTHPEGTPYAPDTYDSSTDTATGVLLLAEDSEVTVYIIGDIPLTAVDGNTSIVSLAARAIEPTSGNVGAVGTNLNATVGANTAGIDTVLGDAGGDGLESTTNVYTVSTATLRVTKSIAIIDDPINGAGANRKAIPGATLEYTIQVQNQGGDIASTVVVTDPVPTNVSYVAGSLTRNGSGLTDASDGDGGQANGTPVTSVAVTVPSIATGATATVTFRVTIN
jgi:uncharacterized repeat protein (TIGR01451 family)